MSYFEISVLVLLGIMIIQIQCIYLTLWGKGGQNPIDNLDSNTKTINHNLITMGKNIGDNLKDIQRKLPY